MFRNLKPRDEVKMKALLEFVLFYVTSDSWPTFTRRSRFWIETEDWWPKFTDR